MLSMTKFALLLLVALPLGDCYKVLSDNDHFQVDRNYCNLACFTSAETKVEALPGDSVDFHCRTDKEDVNIRKLWTTDGGQYVASNRISFMERHFISENGSTLRISPIRKEDDQKSLWCNLLVFDSEENRWRPRKTIRHFLYVGEGKMIINPEDFINLDIREDNVLYYHKKVNEFSNDEKLEGSQSIANVDVENIFFNGTMENDRVFEDEQTDVDGEVKGTVREEKQFIDLGEKFKKTIKAGQEKMVSDPGISLASLVKSGSASSGANPLQAVILPSRPGSATNFNIWKTIANLTYLAFWNWMTIAIAYLYSMESHLLAFYRPA